MQIRQCDGVLSVTGTRKLPRMSLYGNLQQENSGKGDHTMQIQRDSHQTPLDVRLIKNDPQGGNGRANGNFSMLLPRRRHGPYGRYLPSDRSVVRVNSTSVGKNENVSIRLYTGTRRRMDSQLPIVRKDTLPLASRRWTEPKRGSQTLRQLSISASNRSI